MSNLKRDTPGSVSCVQRSWYTISHVADVVYVWNAIPADSSKKDRMLFICRESLHSSICICRDITKLMIAQTNEKKSIFFPSGYTSNIRQTRKNEGKCTYEVNGQCYMMVFVG